ncbi:MAG: diguanylate cyclase [Pseudomonadota bacterium]
MAYVIIVESDRLIASSLATNLSQKQGISVRVVTSYREAFVVLNENPGLYSCIVLNLDEKDFNHDVVVDFLATTGLPAIAITAHFDQTLRDTILSLQIVDYFIKQNLNEIEQITALVGRIHRNRDIRVLIAESSSAFQKYLTELMQRYQFQVFTANNAQEAIQWIDSRQNKPMDIILVEYELDKGNGCRLVSQIRTRLHREDVIIIGIADRENPTQSVSMFKAGVNDFIGKPFLQEEFACRISQNVEMLENLRSIKSHSTKDFLTGLNNRRYLYDVGSKFYHAALAQHLKLTCALIDIDSLRTINEKYGHHIGDLTLQQIAKLLLDEFDPFHIVTRYGGEEFCVLLIGQSLEAATAIMKNFETIVLEKFFGTDYDKFQISLTIGLSQTLGSHFEQLLNNAYAELCHLKNEKHQSLLR